MREFIDRPKLRQWKLHTRRLRWERRLARAPYYRLYLAGLFTLAVGLLLATVLISIWLGR